MGVLVLLGILVAVVGVPKLQLDNVVIIIITIVPPYTGGSNGTVIDTTKDQLLDQRRAKS